MKCGAYDAQSHSGFIKLPIPLLRSATPRKNADEMYMVQKWVEHKVAPKIGGFEGVMVVRQLG